MSKTDRSDRIKQAQAHIEAAVASFQDSDQWRTYLKHAARFHKYSANNQLLIWAQSEGQASKVAGFKAWLKMERCVRKGETALYIYAPMFFTRPHPQTGEPEQVKRFGLAAVFDVAQTDIVDGAKKPYVPLAILPMGAGDEWEAGQTLSFLTEVALDLGVTQVTFEDNPGNACYRPRSKSIAIQPRFGMCERVMLLAHELAHHLTQPKPDQEAVMTYDQNELVAEAVAFIVGQHVGLDSELRSAQYITQWQRENAAVTFQQALGIIQQTAKTIIDALDTLQGADQIDQESEAA